jgi:hypothetical protein
MGSKLTKQQIHEILIDSLADSIREHSELNKTPLEVEVDFPLPPKLRVYGYRVTTPPGSGPNGEHIARLIVPGQNPGERSSFDHSEGYFVLLLGYAPEREVFILWDAGLHRDFLYSKKVRVNPGPVFEAVAGNIGSQERHLHTGTEIVLTANMNNLSDAIELRSKLTTERLIN